MPHRSIRHAPPDPAGGTDAAGVELAADLETRSTEAAVPPATVRLFDVGRIAVADRGEWAAPDAEVAELFAAAREATRSPEALAVLSGADSAGELCLEGGLAGHPVAARCASPSG